MIDDPAIDQQILEVILQEGMIDRSKLTPDATFESLGVQSIDVVMVLMAIEEKFGIYIPMDGDLTEVKNLRGFIDHITGRILQQRAKSAS
jgi:acyl carrier protein